MRYLLLILPFFFYSCTKKEETSNEPSAYPVRVSNAVLRDVPIYTSAIGHVDPITVINVQSRVEGKLIKTYFKEGSTIKKGDLLFLIDPRPFEAKLNKAKARYDQTIASLHLAEEQVKRFSPLVKEEYYSQNDFDSLVTSKETNSAQLKEDEANIETASLDLNYCYIHSPINGVLGISKVDTGNMVFPIHDETLVTINQIEPIYVKFFLPENQLQRLFSYKRKNPIKVEVELDDLEKSIIQGDLNLIDNEVNTQTGMITIRGEFSNEDHKLWPGEFVKTRLIYTIEKDAVVIPFQAVQKTPSGYITYVVKNDNTVDKREIILGQREDEDIIIKKGIQVDEKVVIEGQLNLSPGTKVFIQKGL